MTAEKDKIERLVKMSKNRMFNFITYTWNPVVGCIHNCVYCWARRQAKRLKRICELCYKFIPHLHENRLNPPSPDGIVFVVDMGDLFCNSVKSTWISKVLQSISQKIAESKRNTLYFLETKNPSRYFEFVDKYSFMDRLIFSTTIETDIDYAGMYSEAPTPYSRYISIRAFHREYPEAKIHLSIEPLLDFNLKNMLKWVVNIDPNFGISIGYDNYNNKLKEPKQEKVERFIELLEAMGYRVERKTIRPAWHELQDIY